MLPEFHSNKEITWKVHLTDKLSTYDMIVGTDLLTELGVKLDFETQQMIWDGITADMHTTDEPIINLVIQDSKPVADSFSRKKGFLTLSIKRQI